MPSIEENRARWGEGGYDWPDGGDEWSAPWGGPAMQWYGTLLPRLHAFLPAPTILEIAPGYGRWTQFLKDCCEQLVVVDLGVRCIEHCRARFHECTHIEYHVNDGKSLDMVASQSIDFAMSFDSLVHADADVVEAYLRQFPRILSRDGVGVLHHSNFADCGPLENPHWRSTSMSAELFAAFCERHGLLCIGQELINWGSTACTDCLSVFTRPGSVWARENCVVRNTRFHEEAGRIKQLSRVFAGDTPTGLASPDRTPAPHASGTAGDRGPGGRLARRLRRALGFAAA